MKSLNSKKGFTLIELTFAIAFISVLLITITLITNEIISLYRKGYAIKTVNQVGRDLIEDFTDSIQNSPPASISSFCSRYSESDSSRVNCYNDDGLYSVYQQYYTQVRIENDAPGVTRTVPVGGLFCNGKYSYIWNTGYVFGDAYKKENGDPLDYDNLRLRLWISDSSLTTGGYYFPYATDSSGNRVSTSAGRNGEFRLVKVEDSARAVCASTVYSSSDSSISYPGSSDTLSIPHINPPSETQTAGIKIDFTPAYDPVELLEDSDAALALYDMVIYPPAQVTISNRLFYSGSFILGTIEGDVNIMTSSNFCQSPTTFSADFSYCAINKFNFSIQASGE